MTISSSDPAGDVVPVSGSGSTTITFRAIRVAGAGNVELDTPAGHKRVCAFLAGETRPIAGTLIYGTSGNTTATGIEAMV